MGFSLNTLSLFGLVLAIGIVVDDAIVVVEATEHHIEQGMTPRAAAHQAMAEVSAPVIAIGLVLASVFVPCVFITGITGRFFRQFALTIAVSTVLSAFNSLTLSPALCAILLKQRHEHRDPLSWLINFACGWFFKLFNKGFSGATDGYLWAVGKLLRVSLLVLLVYGGLLVPDPLELRADAHRLHPRPGPGLSVRGHPASRFGLDGADRSGDGPRRRHHPLDQGGCPYDPHLRHVVRDGGQRLAPGHDVRGPRSVRGAPRRRSCGPTRWWPRCSARSSSRSKRPR